MPLADARIKLPERYRVVRHVANGGMASVWAAQDGVLGRLVAVKVLAAHVAADPSARVRFEREARTAARVSDHPNVVTIYDVGEHDDVPFIVMELFSGGSVADRLRGGDVPRTRALAWLEQAAGALDHAHAAGIVHRDVKPANLLLDERERLAVGDFGIARAADDTNLTQVGQVLGTAAYLSPEQAVGESATPASDRYALGVVAYELMTGRRPFQGEHVAAQARQHVEGKVPSTGLAPDVDDVLRRAMAKAPDERYPTATRFVEELRAVAGRIGEPPTEPTRHAPRPRRAVPVAPAAPAPSPPTGEPAHARRTHSAGRGGRRGIVALLAALALAAAALAAVLLTRDADETSGTRSADRPAATRAQETQPEADRTGAGDPVPGQMPEEQPQQAQQPSAAAQRPTPSADNEAEDGPGPSDTGESPSSLNARGYSLLRSGDAEAAIPVLERAIKGFEAMGDGANRIEWGYALYNLGQAFLQAGRPQEAVAAFERRLQVSPDDQRAEVERALARARKAAGQASSGGSSARGDDDGAKGKGKGNGRDKGKDG